MTTTPDPKPFDPVAYAEDVAEDLLERLYDGFQEHLMDPLFDHVADARGIGADDLAPDTEDPEINRVAEKLNDEVQDAVDSYLFEAIRKQLGFEPQNKAEAVATVVGLLRRWEISADELRDGMRFPTIPERG